MKSLFTRFLLLLVSEVSFGRHLSIMQKSSFGQEAIEFHAQSGFSGHGRILALDGKESFPDTQSITYDRLVVTFWQAALAHHFSPKLGLRLDLNIASGKRKKYSKSFPRKIITDDWFVMEPKFQMVYMTNKKLEVLSGLILNYYSSMDRSSQTSSFNTQWRFDSVLLQQPFIGLVKRSSQFGGGFYYKFGTEKTRNVKKISDFTKEPYEFIVSDVIHLATSVGLFIEYKSQSLKMYGEFTTIEAGEGGQKDENGQAVFEEHSHVRVYVGVPIFLGNVKFGLNHKTISYADNLNVSLGTIPLTVGSISWAQDKNESLYFGCVYGIGNDGQSLPEFNARFTQKIYGIEGGVRYLL